MGMGRALLGLGLFVVLACPTQAEKLGSLPPSNVTFFEVDLAEDPKTRWNSLVQAKKGDIKEALQLIKKYIPGWIHVPLKALAGVVAHLMGDKGREMEGIAHAADISTGDVVLLNLASEFVQCTSMVVQDDNGKIYHGRNLDWGDKGTTQLFQNLTVGVRFTNMGSLQYTATTFAGYVGVLTGMRHGKISVSSDWRDGSTWKSIFHTIFTGAKPRGFLMRDVLQDDLDFYSARSELESKSIIGPVYFILGGAEPWQGAVLARSGSKTVASHGLNNATKKWYVVETNYDWWTGPPDFRRAHAIEYLDAMTEHVTLPTLYTDVISRWPLMRNSTVYTTMMSASTGGYYAYNWAFSHHAPYHPPTPAGFAGEEILSAEDAKSLANLQK